MAKKQKILLPKLPYGEGSYSWHDREKGIIRFRKMIGVGEHKKSDSVTGASIAECNRKMKKKEQNYIDTCKHKQQQDPKNKSLTFAQSTYNWMTTFKVSTLKGRSYDTMESTYQTHVLTTPFAKCPVEAVSDVDIQNHINKMLKNGAALSTVKKVYSFYKLYFRYYYQSRPYDDPMISVVIPTQAYAVQDDSEKKLHDINDDEYIILDDIEIELFTQAATIPIKFGVCGYRYGWGLVFILWSFIRYGEAVGLRWQDVNFEESYMVVRRTFSRVIDRDSADKKYKWDLVTPKSKSSHRKIWLCNQAKNALLNFRSIQNPTHESDFIFSTSSGKPVSDSYLNETMHRILYRAGIAKPLTAHGLRHTGISYFLRHGVSADVVAKMAGHRTKQITQQVYYTILDEQQKIELEKINL